MTQICIFFFFNDTATTEIYTLSLHDALPIYELEFSGRISPVLEEDLFFRASGRVREVFAKRNDMVERSEEHTFELQSRQYLVCRLLLEKKKNKSLLCSFSQSILTSHTSVLSS